MLDIGQLHFFDLKLSWLKLSQFADRKFGLSAYLDQSSTKL